MSSVLYSDSPFITQVAEVLRCVFVRSLSCLCVYHSPDGQYVAAGSSDGSLFVWDTISSKSKREKCKEHRYRALA